MSGSYIAGYPGIASNVSYISQCTPSLCSLDYATIRYVPNAASNLFFASLFALFLLTHLILWVIRRTHSFSFAMCCGLFLEILGYLARVVMKMHLFESTPFLIQIICLTIAPVFFTAALYLTLSRVIMHYGAHNSRLSPKAYTVTFICSDFIALVLQSVGGALADTAATMESENTGVHVMVAGLSFQVISLIAFILLCAEFFWRVRNDRKQVAATNWANREIGGAPPDVKGYKIFLLAFSLSTILILVRSCFRVAELAHGFHGKLANDQVIFMILEGGVMILATLLLTAFAPGRYIGSEWKNSGWGAQNRGNIITLEKVGSELESEGLPSVHLDIN